MKYITARRLNLFFTGLKNGVIKTKEESMACTDPKKLVGNGVVKELNDSLYQLETSKKINLSNIASNVPYVLQANGILNVTIRSTSGIGPHYIGTINGVDRMIIGRLPLNTYGCSEIIVNKGDTFVSKPTTVTDLTIFFIPFR